MSKSYEKHIKGNDVFFCSMTDEEQREYCADQQKEWRRHQQKQSLPTSEVPYRAKSPYEKCEVCGRPYLTYGKPCDHVDRRPRTRLMPDWMDNPAEWRMLCDRYDSISPNGMFGQVRNGDGTYSYERLA